MSSTLLVGTRKGLLTFERSGGTWKIARTDHEGIPIAYAIRDRRTGVTWASLEHGHWGAKMHRSDNGTDWEEVSAEYPDTAVDKEGEKVAMESIWYVAPAGDDQKDRLLQALLGGEFPQHQNHISIGITDAVNFGEKPGADNMFG